MKYQFDLDSQLKSLCLPDLETKNQKAKQCISNLRLSFQSLQRVNDARNYKNVRKIYKIRFIKNNILCRMLLL